MAWTSAQDQALRLLARALDAGAVVEIGGRALALVAAPGPVVPLDRGGAWPGFLAREAGIFVCCPLLPGLPTALLAPTCRGWLRLGETDELLELLPVAEWLAAMGDAGARAFVVGLLHGLGRIAEGAADAPTRPGARPLIRAPDSLARELFG